MGFHQARFHVKDHVSQNGEMLPIFMNDKSSKSETYLENKVMSPVFVYFYIGIFESPKCDVNPQPNTRGIGPLVGRTSGNRRSVMHALVEFFSITYNFSFICQYIFIWLISSGREIFPLLKYPGKCLVFE